MNKLCFPIVGLITTIGFTSGCCSWNFNKENFEFTKEELNLLGAYNVGDTIYFESNWGDIDTINVVAFSEERQEGSRCFISRVPSNSKSINIKHLPNDKWAGTSQSENGEKKITYQTLISISKSPLDSIEKIPGYAISFKGFTTLKGSLSSTPREITINGKIISDCYKVTHGYLERVINPNDIEIVYWTAKYGLTAYTSKAGETWLLKKID